MAGRDAMIELLLAEEEKAMRPKEKKRGITPEDVLGFGAAAAPIAGTVLGSVVGGPAGGAVGGGVGALGGLGLGMAASKMREDRERKEMEEEERAMREYQKKRAIASLL